MSLRERLFGVNGGDEEECGLCLDHDPDLVFDLISNQRRRRTIEAVAARGETSLDDLANDLACLEADEVPVPSTKRKAVYVGLYQNHLPALEESGVIEWEQGHYLVATERAHDLAELLDRIYEIVECER